MGAWSPSLKIFIDRTVVFSWVMIKLEYNVKKKKKFTLKRNNEGRCYEEPYNHRRCADTEWLCNISDNESTKINAKKSLCRTLNKSKYLFYAGDRLWKSLVAKGNH